MWVFFVVFHVLLKEGLNSKKGISEMIGPVKEEVQG
jgi:hypothetical protein